MLIWTVNSELSFGLVFAYADHFDHIRAFHDKTIEL